MRRQPCERISKAAILLLGFIATASSIELNFNYEDSAPNTNLVRKSNKDNTKQETVIVQGAQKDLSSEVQALLERINSFEKANIQFKIVSDKIANENAELRKSIAEASAKITDNGQSKELIKASETEKAKKDELDALLKQVASVNDEIQYLQAFSSRYISKLAESEENLKTVFTLNTKLNENYKFLTSKAAESSQLDAQIIAINKKIDENNVRLSKEIQNFNQQDSLLKTTIDQSNDGEKNIAILNAQIAKFKSDFDTLSASYSDYKIKNPEGSPIVVEYKNQINTLIAQISDLKSKINGASDITGSNLDSLKAELKRATDENDNVKKQWDIVSAQLNKLQDMNSALTNLQNEIVQMKALSIRLKNQSNFWQKKYTESKRDSDKAENDKMNFDASGSNDDGWISSQINSLNTNTNIIVGSTN